ncbi:MAG TPA: hypothetical protein VEW05_09415, partial [Candidatus Polarisedimenticolia bacterium]|nr:hypothetical protein [Candidatus Polarisedimenticolia bacterium]
RASKFTSNRNALAPFRRPDKNPFCRRRQHMTALERTGWCFFVRCPREGTFVPADKQAHQATLSLFDPSRHGLLRAPSALQIGETPISIHGADRCQ